MVGSNTWDAWRAAKQLSLRWNLPAGSAALNSAQFLADAQSPRCGGAPLRRRRRQSAGNALYRRAQRRRCRAAIARATKTVDATYSLPYVAHACMEVLDCTVDYVPNVRCTVWAPTQSAKSALSLVSGLTGLAPESVVIHVTYLGGGLGRKFEHDFIARRSRSQGVAAR